MKISPFFIFREFETVFFFGLYWFALMVVAWRWFFFFSLGLHGVVDTPNLFDFLCSFVLGVFSTGSGGGDLRVWGNLMDNLG